MNTLRKFSATLLLSFVFAVSASATCFQTCDDTDAGVDPRGFGVVVVNTSCSPPGGPVNTTRAEYFDRCEDGTHTEFSCAGAMPGVDGAKRKTIRCGACDPTRKGVCLKPGKTISEAPAADATYSCSSTSGGGGPQPPAPPAPTTPNEN